MNRAFFDDYCILGTLLEFDDMAQAFEDLTKPVVPALLVNR
jgi:hypothetical protein